MYKSDLQYGEILVRPCLNTHTVFSKLEVYLVCLYTIGRWNFSNIKGHVSSTTKSTSATAKFNASLYADTCTQQLFPHADDIIALWQLFVSLL